MVKNNYINKCYEQLKYSNNNITSKININCKETRNLLRKKSVNYLSSKEKINDISLKTFTEELNKKCLNRQNFENELVSTELMMKAKEIVDAMIPKTKSDVLLYCVSLNVLNVYVKQKQNKLTYYFKKNVVDVLINNIVKNDINVKYYFTTDKGVSICYIKVYDIVFSFHQIPVKKISKKVIQSFKNQRIFFDNIRKQKIAVTLFESVYSYLYSH